MFDNPFLRFSASFYNFFIKVGSNLQSLFLLYMRITWGHQLFMAGLGKLSNIDPVVQFFVQLRILEPSFTAHTVAILETVCGFCLFVGLASRLAAIPTIIIMLSALATAHSAAISDFKFLFEPISLVRETPYPFLITALLVFVFGPGRVSIDAWIKRRLDKKDYSA
jgi:putative oxidoreductase